MKTHLVAAGLLVAGLATANAQTPSPHATAPAIDAKSPADCTKGLNDWRTAQIAPAMATLRAAPADNRADAIKAYQAAYAAVSAEAVRSAKACGAKFSVDHT